MQPLLISTSFSSARLRLTSRWTSLPSILISLISLTMTATFRPWRFFRMALSRVLLPAPRKPDSTVTGRRLVMVSGSISVTQVFFPLFLAFLGFDAQARGGPQQQTLEADRLAGFDAPAVLTAGQAVEGFVDLVEQLLFPLQQAQLPLPLLLDGIHIVIRRLGEQLGVGQWGCAHRQDSLAL